MKDNKVRINKKFAAWSNGEEIRLVPSVRHDIDNYGKMIIEYKTNLDEGNEIWCSNCAVVRNECRCSEYEADHYWELGDHLAALKEMMRAAMQVLPDESVGFEFEDMQWLDPEETLYWHPNVQEFLRYNRRCIDYCKRDPRLWPILKCSRTYRDYRNYLATLGHWAHDTHNNTYRNCW